MNKPFQKLPLKKQKQIMKKVNKEADEMMKEIVEKPEVKN